MGYAEFSGTYSHNIDPKGRVTIPAAYRETLGESFTLGLNNDLKAMALYPAETWREISERLNRIPDSDARGMAYVRLIKATSYTDQKLDGQGRLLLPANLRQMVGMDKAICFVGAGRKLEIWDEAAYARITAETIENFADLMSYVDNRYFSSTEG